MEELQAISNVIELKPDHKYLFVFSGSSIPDQKQTAQLLQALKALHIESISLAIQNQDELRVIEADVSQ